MRQALRIVCGLIACAVVTANRAAALCPAAPLTGCKQPTAADKALLLLKNKGGSGNKMVWKWIKGEATAIGDFDNPADVATYNFCLYDETGGTPTLKMSAVVPPSANWAATKKGFKYNDPAAATAGIKGILLNSGATGKAKIIVKGADAALALPTLPLALDPVAIVQLSNSGGVCWETRFSSPTKKNDTGQFKDKGDGPVTAPTPTATVAGPPPTATPTTAAGAPTATRTNTRTATNTATAPAATSTPTHTPTPLAAPPTATPTTAAAACGDGFCEANETLATCPADCTILACTATTPLQTFRVNFNEPLGAVVSLTQVRVDYKSNLVSLPGSGSGAGSRVKNRPAGTSQLVNDLNVALQVTISEQMSGTFLSSGSLFTVDFDTCSGHAAATPGDFRCEVLQCSSSFGDTTGCTCTVTTP